MMGLKRKHWPPCNYRALISLKNTRLSYQEKGSCSTQNLWIGITAASPVTSSGKDIQIPTGAQKRPQEKRDCDLCNHLLQQLSKAVMELCNYSLQIQEDGKREKVFYKNQEKKNWELTACGSKHYLQAQKLSGSLCPTTQSQALPCWPRKLWCCTWLIQTLLLPCSQHRHLTNNDCADKLERELCL